MALRPSSRRSKNDQSVDDFFIPSEDQELQERFKTGLPPRGVNVSRAVVKNSPPAAVRLSAYRTIATMFIVVALLLLGVVLYLSFARATIAVTPRAEDVSAPVELIVAPEAKNETTVPGYVLETVVDGSKKVPLIASSSAKIVAANACGTVTITNRQSQPQPLVEKTRLLSKEGVLFRITRSITVPADGTLEVKACADQPGASGEIGPTTFTIPGLTPAKQERTTASSAAAMTGGELKVAVLTEEDLKQATEKFAEELAAAGLDKLKKIAPAGMSGVLIAKNLVKRETDGRVGVEQSSFNLSLSVHVVGVFYDPLALGQAAAAALRSFLTKDRELLSVDSAGLETKLNKADPAQKQASITVKISGRAASRLSADSFDWSQIAGRPRAVVESYLRSIPAVAAATVKLTPSWARTVPTIRDHVDIEILKAR